MKNNMTAEDLALKLEQKAKSLREHGLSSEDMEMVAGGGCTCCGSSCQGDSAFAWNACGDNPYDASTGTCQYSCISSSPD